MPSTKDQVKAFTAKAKASILEGNEDPVKIAIQLAGLEKVLKELRGDDKIRETICEELMKYERGTTEVNGAKVEIAEVGVRYDYQDDHVLQELAQKKLSIDNAIKERQEMIKGLKASVYDQDGIEIKPAVRRSTTSYKVTIK